MKKLSFVLVALAALVLFAGCANGNSNSGSGSGADSNTGSDSYDTIQEKAVYKGSSTHGNTVNYTWTFETNGTFSGTAIDARHLEYNDGTVPEVYISGTYLGNAAKDGKIKITIKKISNGSSLEDCNDTSERTISNGKFSYGSTEFVRQ